MTFGILDIGNISPDKRYDGKKEASNAIWYDKSWDFVIIDIVIPRPSTPIRNKPESKKSKITFPRSGTLNRSFPKIVIIATSNIPIIK